MTDENKQTNARRNFIKKSIAGAAGISVLPSLGRLKADTLDDTDSGKVENKIIYRTLGRTGYKLPIISMGTSTNEYIIKAALKSGIKHFDSAHFYGKGLDEATYGRALRDVPRDSFIFATKILGLRENNSIPENVSAEEYKKDFKNRLYESLRRLQLDYTDILYFHSVDDPKLLQHDMVKEAMLELKDEGKVRHLGVSTHTSSVIYSVVEQEIFDVILVAHNFREADPEISKKAIRHATEAGCGIVGMKSLAGVYWDQERKQLINPKAAVKWLIQDENIHTTIMSINNFDQLELYMSLMNDLTLTSEEKKDLRLDEKDDTVGLYCNQCNECLPQCPHGLDIPKVMRSYMYAYAYQKPSKAKETMGLVDSDTIKCNLCPVCNVNCPSGFNVRKKVKDISRIVNVPDEFLV